MLLGAWRERKIGGTCLTTRDGDVIRRILEAVCTNAGFGWVRYYSKYEDAAAGKI